MKPQGCDTLDRRLLALDVQLLYRPLGVVNALTHWVSEEAMHIDTGRVRLPRLGEVEITFPHRRDAGTTYHRILAQVSHRAEEQTTLRFLRCSREAHRALHDLIHAERH